MPVKSVLWLMHVLKKGPQLTPLSQHLIGSKFTLETFPGSLELNIDCSLKKGKLGDAVAHSGTARSPLYSILEKPALI